MGAAARIRAAWGAFKSGGEGSAPTASAGRSANLVNGLADTEGATFFNILGQVGTGAAIGEKAALSVPAVLRALEVLCGVFAMTPLVYYRRLPDGGKERATSSPLYTLFHDRPNPTQSIFAFKEVLLGDLLMQGKFASFIHRDPLYRPAALTRLTPFGFAVSQQWDRTDGHELFFDASLPDGTRQRLTRNDCWYVPGFSRDGLLGVERLKLVGDTIAAAAATSEFAHRFWVNNAQPSTILTAKGKIEGPAKEQIKSDWRARFGGVRNAGGVAVLDQEMDAKFLAHDNKASQFIETRAFYVLEIARAWGVPPHLLFELGRATFSNIEQQSLDFIQYCMLSHYERIASAATHAFAEPDHFFEFLPDALLKGDLKSRYDAYAIGVDKGVLSPNEVRRKENMNDRDGGDEYRVGSGSTVEGQQPSSPPPAPPPPLDDPGGEED